MTYQVFDTTLRDGAQREGITYSVADKLAVARLLDELGVGFIEGGWPGAMPKDTEFFRRARSELELKHAILVAFGATRRADLKADADPQVRALLDAETQAVCLVAKSDARHVERALRTTREENLAMVRDTVAFFHNEGRRVFLDCEHFFDGFRFDPAYTTSVVAAALEAGAEVTVMCDTNGGMLPSMVTAAVDEVSQRLAVLLDSTAEAVVRQLGIHCQNDTSCAVANTVAAVEEGARRLAAGEPDVFTQMPLKQTMKVEKLRYLTDPLPNDLSVVGPICLTLYASIDQEDTNWIIVLKDVGPDVSVQTARQGERTVPAELPERELTRGWLKASYRALDEERSTPWEPFHKLTRSSIKPVTPGEVIEYKIQVLGTANMFKAGHRIALEITCMDAPDGTGAMTGVEYIPYHVCSSRTVTHKIFRDGRYPSHLLLPIIPQSPAET